MLSVCLLLPQALGRMICPAASSSSLVCHFLIGCLPPPGRTQKHCASGDSFRCNLHISAPTDSLPPLISAGYFLPLPFGFSDLSFFFSFSFDGFIVSPLRKSLGCLSSQVQDWGLSISGSSLLVWKTKAWPLLRPAGQGLRGISWGHAATVMSGERRGERDPEGAGDWQADFICSPGFCSPNCFNLCK